jgi:hypothetical protein
MTHQDNAAAIIKNLPDGRNGCFYPRVVSDLEFFIQGTLKSTRINAF